MPGAKLRRGSCPRCNGRKVQHYIAGMPDFTAFVDDEGNVPEWVNFSGCVIGPGPQYDRSCDACGLRWSSWSTPRAVFSTWRDVRDDMGVATNREADEWLYENVAPITLIHSFPRLDDPGANIDVWNGMTHKTLQFPFTHAEWQAILLDVFDGGGAEFVKDTRFTTVVDDLDDLLSAVDVDELGDIETLLMFLFARPVGVEEVWDNDGVATSLNVVVRGNHESIGSVYAFPLGVMKLVRSCAQTVEELGPYTRNGFTPSEETQDVLAMSDAELIAALQQALGLVRLFNLMDDDE